MACQKLARVSVNRVNHFWPNWHFRTRPGRRVSLRRSNCGQIGNRESPGVTEHRRAPQEIVASGYPGDVGTVLAARRDTTSDGKRSSQRVGAKIISIRQPLDHNRPYVEGKMADMTLISVLLPLAGLIAGAGAVAVSERLGQGQSWLTGQMPSAPVLLGGAIAGGAIGAISAFAAPTGTSVATAFLGWLLLTLGLIDFRVQILPNGLNLLVFLLGGGVVVVTKPDAWTGHVLGAIAGYATLRIVETLYRNIRGFDGLGRGDAKLLGALGIWVTWAGIPPVLLIASLSGICVVLISVAFRKERITSTTALAFGPWIALGGWITWLAGPVVSPVLLG